MKRAIQTVQKAGAQGVRVQCSGRLGGSEMARKSPTRRPCTAAHSSCRHRLRLSRGEDLDRPDRDQVWIYKGDILPYKTSAEEKISLSTTKKKKFKKKKKKKKKK